MRIRKPRKQIETPQVNARIIRAVGKICTVEENRYRLNKIKLKEKYAIATDGYMAVKVRVLETPIATPCLVAPSAFDPKDNRQYEIGEKGINRKPIETSAVELFPDIEGKLKDWEAHEAATITLQIPLLKKALAIMEACNAAAVQLAIPKKNKPLQIKAKHARRENPDALKDREQDCIYIMGMSD